jgi:hypothetical protein
MIGQFALEGFVVVRSGVYLRFESTAKSRYLDLRQVRSLDQGVNVMVMVLDATFNNISTMSLRSVLLAEESGIPGENHRPAASH